MITNIGTPSSHNKMPRMDVASLFGNVASLFGSVKTSPISEGSNLAVSYFPASAKVV
jgi:hypothetical protein